MQGIWAVPLSSANQRGEERKGEEAVTFTVSGMGVGEGVSVGVGVGVGDLCRTGVSEKTEPSVRVRVLDQSE